MPTLLTPVLVSVIALITVFPDSVAFHLGPIPILWYGLGYAIGLAAAYVVITREARRRGLDARLVDNGIIIVAAAALIGGRLYHVIDQWALYKDDPLKIILPPYTGLGVYGGIVTGTIAAYILTRRWHQSFLRWADVIVPGLFTIQAIARWGNFFNQELYGPPTTLPWGITIECAHRIPAYPCTTYPEATTGFHPLFLYESISGVIGVITLLWIARRFGPRMRPGDLMAIFFIWYAVVRFALETLRADNWTFFGVPTAMLVSGAIIVAALAFLVYRHGPWVRDPDVWGEPPQRDDDTDVVDDELVDEDEDADEDDPIEGEPADDELLEDDEPADDEEDPSGEDEPLTAGDQPTTGDGGTEDEAEAAHGSSEPGGAGSDGEAARDRDAR
jgi:phosphatidylglycerol:prolipoprotein diacylglycerol transferase